MAEFMLKMKEEVPCGLVGGSDLNKIAEQMGGLEGEAVMSLRTSLLHLHYFQEFLVEVMQIFEGVFMILMICYQDFFITKRRNHLESSLSSPWLLKVIVVRKQRIF